MPKKMKAIKADKKEATMSDKSVETLGSTPFPPKQSEGYMYKRITVDFNSLWSRKCGNILRTWELRSRIHGFIVIDGNQIANFETKTRSLISKFDSRFA